uniref:C2H2-type domain-containing protein n=1 Tax=Compsopogon caeruleus TaxID=31354 RepID=A0A7S1TFY1_9RHOD|mmetsp:Transcript_4803/g.9705  ORF Transcript_4803/g.9705 Transcript_4803/m.9705 type:complete len:170 (+) Transcript_4803:167-676(+)
MVLRVDLETLEPQSRAEREALALVKRMVRKTRKKSFQCDFSDCGRVLSTKYNLSVHRRLHTGATPFKCKEPGCFAKFRWASSLKAHEGTHSKDIRLEVDEEDKKKEPLMQCEPGVTVICEEADTTSSYSIGFDPVDEYLAKLEVPPHGDEGYKPSELYPDDAFPHFLDS